MYNLARRALRGGVDAPGCRRRSTFYVGLTQTAKPVPARARLTYLPETLQAVAGAQSVSIRSDAESLPARVKRYFGALDTLDADAVAAFFAVGATVRLPGLAPILGRAAIRRALVQFSLDVDDLRHAPVQLWTAGNLSVFEADMTLTFAGRTALAFPVTHIITRASSIRPSTHRMIWVTDSAGLSRHPYHPVGGWPDRRSARERLSGIPHGGGVVRLRSPADRRVRAAAAGVKGTKGELRSPHAGYASKARVLEDPRRPGGLPHLVQQAALA